MFGHVLAAFRYGREDLDVLGLTFRKVFLGFISIRNKDYSNATIHEKCLRDGNGFQYKIFSVNFAS